MFCGDWDKLTPKLEYRKYKQKALLKSWKTEIKFLANPGLAYSQTLSSVATRLIFRHLFDKFLISFVNRSISFANQTQKAWKFKSKFLNLKVQQNSGKTFCYVKS